MKVMRLYEDANLPTVKHEHDAGMDFYSLEDYVIKPQTFQICRTGIIVEIPQGVVGQIWPKSKNGWLIGGGIVDWTYQGEILFKIFNVSDYDIVIRYGDPLGQMVFVYNLEPTVEEVDEIHVEKTARGSTGGIVTEVQTIDSNFYPLWVAKWSEDTVISGMSQEQVGSIIEQIRNFDCPIDIQVLNKDE